MYRSTATVLVLNELSLEASERLINTHAELVKLPILAETKSKLSLPRSEDELAGQISVSANFTSQFVHITARDSDPNEAADIANTIATIFVQRTTSELARPTPTTGTEVLRRSFLRLGEKRGLPRKPIKYNIENPDRYRPRPCGFIEHGGPVRLAGMGYGVRKIGWTPPFASPCVSQDKRQRSPSLAGKAISRH